MTDASKRVYLIEKRGLYYRPKSAGYTGLKTEAGRYSFEEAAVIVGPNGPEGAQDGMSMWEAHEAPEYSSGCAWDVKMKDKAYREGFSAAVKAGREQKEQLRTALQNVADFRQNAEAYDEDVGHEVREWVDVEEWEMVEDLARIALKKETST